jgi:hypothetical protein
VRNGRYAYRNGRAALGFQGLYCVAVISIVGGMWLGPRQLERPLAACLAVVMGIAGLVGGDRWGLTESRSRAVRFLGRTVMFAFAGAMFWGAYFSSVHK